jgi:RimJ/RimL family protein N-acetyltransferase
VNPRHVCAENDRGKPHGNRDEAARALDMRRMALLAGDYRICNLRVIHTSDSDIQRTFPASSPQMRYAVFTLTTRDGSGVFLKPKYRFHIWRPTLTHVIPPRMSIRRIDWWLFHYLRVFLNRDYAVLLIADGSRIVHRSCVIPASFRYPFMDAKDVQIGATWTDRAYRGQGLATTALRQAVSLTSRSNCRFWYIALEDNVASSAVCLKVGFALHGYARILHEGNQLLERMVMLEDSTGQK